MEFTNFRNYDRDQSLPLPPEGGSDRRPNTPDISRLAGHVTLFEGRSGAPARRLRPHVPETVLAAALKDESQPAPEVQYSSWHRIEKGKDGQVKSLEDQHYGEEMAAQINVEQGMTGALSGGQTPPSQVSQQPLASPVHPASQPSAYPSSQAVVEPQPQPVNILPQFRRPSSQAQLPQEPVSAVRPPVYTPATQRQRVAKRSLLSSAQPDPMLTAGSLIQDPEHMISSPPKYKIILVFKSPWFWLVVGVGLVVYFV